jgi:hypothetical protein
VIYVAQKLPELPQMMALLKDSLTGREGISWSYEKRMKYNVVLYVHLDMLSAGSVGRAFHVAGRMR